MVIIIAFAVGVFGFLLGWSIGYAVGEADGVAEYGEWARRRRKSND